MRKVFLGLSIALFLILMPHKSFAAGFGLSDPLDAYVEKEGGIQAKDGTIIPYGTKITVWEELLQNAAPNYYFSDGKVKGSLSIDDFTPSDPALVKKEKFDELKEYVLFEDALVFEGPAAVFNVVGNLPGGTKVTPLYYSGDVFVYIECNGINGWICKVPDCLYVDGGLFERTDYYNHVYQETDIYSWRAGEKYRKVYAGDRVHVVGNMREFYYNARYFVIEINGKYYAVPDGYFDYCMGRHLTETEKLHVINPELVVAYESSALETVIPFPAMPDEIVESHETHSYYWNADEAFLLSYECVTYQGKEYFIDMLKSEAEGVRGIVYESDYDGYIAAMAAKEAEEVPKALEIEEEPKTTETENVKPVKVKKQNVVIDTSYEENEQKKPADSWLLIAGIAALVIAGVVIVLCTKRKED